MTGDHRPAASTHPSGSSAGRSLDDDVAAELVMSEGEDRAWRLLQALPDPVVVIDGDGVIELVNVQAVDLFGYPAEEMVGQHVELLIPAELRERHRALRSDYVASEHPKPMTTGPDIVAVRRDGTAVPVEITLSAITLATGLAVLASIRDVSDLRAADAELRISNERFRVSFDSAPIGMALLDLRPARAGTFLRVNRALCELTGYSESDLLLSSSPAITHPEDRGETISNLDRLVRGAATRWTTEKRYVSATGEDVWVHFAVSVVHDVDGIPSYGVTQVEDITARKRSEAQMAERFHELATNVGVGFAVRRLDPPEYLYVNPAFLTILGLDERIAGPPSLDDAMARVHPHDRELVESSVRAAAGGTATAHAWRIVDPDGRVRWISERISPIVDEYGAIPRVASVMEDVTDRKAAELALQESEQRYDQLARNIDVGVFLRTDTEMLYMNPALSTIFGVAPNPPYPSVSQTTSQIHGDDLGRALEVLAAAERGESARVEMRIVRPDGEVRWVTATRDRVATPDGEPARFAGTVIDITERKAAEEEVLAARAEAERANAAKDVLLSRTSHELRTPLNAVLGFASLLEADDLTDEQRDDVSQIRQSGEHLLGLIDEVLDIDGAERGRLRLSMEPVHVLDVTAGAVAMLQPLAAQRRVSLVVDAEQLDVHVHADVQRFKQVLVNLVANAVKYNRDDGEIRVAGQRGAERLRIEVRDTGIGIAEDDLRHVFEPFERFATDVTQVEGTGLGLAVTKSLVAAMGGEVGAASRLGEGSVFWVELPITPAPGVASPAPPTHPAADSAPIRTDVRTVLCVEDNPSNIRLLERVLAARPGVSMEVCASGRQGIDRALRQPPDIVLLDLHLPDISGHEVLRALRSDPRTATVPVVVLSGDAMPGTSARLLAAGATAYVTKPLDLSLVLRLVDDLAVPRGAGRTGQADPGQAVAEADRRSPSPLPLGEFAGDVYRELGVILTYCSVLDRAGDPSRTAAVAAVRKAAEATAGLVAGLLGTPRP